MAVFELVRCRIAIQVCIGVLPSGRDSHRTFSITNVDPDISADAVANFVRKIAPLLAYPVTMVRLVRKYRLVMEAERTIPLRDLSQNQTNEDRTIPPGFGVAFAQRRDGDCQLPLTAVSGSDVEPQLIFTH
jgi:hypothetical protein